jgi:hypothetical protein
MCVNRRSIVALIDTQHPHASTTEQGLTGTPGRQS